MSIELLKQVVASDPKVMAYNRVVSETRRTMNFVTMTTEVENLHRSRKSRKLYSVAADPIKLYDAATDDIRARGRIAEIWVSAFKARFTLETALKNIKEYILMEYEEDLVEMATTKEARNRLLDQLFNRSTQLLCELSALEQICSMFAQDIDKAGYGITNSFKTVEALQGRRGVSGTV